MTVVQHELFMHILAGRGENTPAQKHEVAFKWQLKKTSVSSVLIVEALSLQ